MNSAPLKGEIEDESNPYRVLVLVLASADTLFGAAATRQLVCDGSVKVHRRHVTDKAMNTGATTELDGKESIDSVKPCPLAATRLAPSTRACHSGRFDKPAPADNPLPTPRSRAPSSGTRHQLSQPAERCRIYRIRQYSRYRQGNLTWRVDSANGQQLHRLRDHGRWQKQSSYSNGGRTNT